MTWPLTAGNLQKQWHSQWVLHSCFLVWFSLFVLVIFYFRRFICWFEMLCLLVQSCLTLFDPTDCSLPGSFVTGQFSRQKYWSGFSCLPPGDLPNPEIELRSPTLQADSLLAEPQGKLKNTGVGSLSLLQGIFLTQESNWHLLHCRQILYHWTTWEGREKPILTL